MADPTLSAKVAALESQLNSLRLQLRGSPGVSTGVAGAMNIRTLQLGFAAELTSTFDQATGYSWKRLRLEPPELLNPGVQPTGLNAFEVSGDETLQSGTRVWMEPSPDAVGYLFSVGIPGAGGQDSACKSFLALPECATLEVVEAYGACACITTGQTASLTRSGDALASDDLLYGCPPGITDADCPNGAPSKFNLVVAGFTGGSTGYNGNWTLSYTATPTPRWTQTRGGVTWFATVEAGGNATLRGGDGVSEPSYEDATVTTCCESLTLSLDDGGGSEDPPATLTLTPATACGNGPAYTPYLSLETDECGDCLRLLWIPVAGSGAASIRWKTIGCGVDGDGKRYAEFASASPLICTDDAEECGENYVVARVTCAACNPLCDCDEGIEWTTAGWYCVSGTCTEYTIAPAGEEVLCYGPFTDFAECMTHFTFPECPECPVWPRQMCFTVESLSTPALVTGVQLPVVWNATTGLWGWSGAIRQDYESGGDDCYIILEYVTISIGNGACSGSLIQMGGTGVGVGGTPYTWSSNQVGGNGGSFDKNLCVFNEDGETTWSGMISPAIGTWEGTLAFDASDCEANPPSQSWDCVNGACVEVYDGSGEYATEAECTTACEGGGGGGCAVEPGDTATLHIEDGDYAGDYNAIWAPFGPIQLQAIFVIPDLGSSVRAVIPYPAVAGTDDSYLVVFFQDYFGEITCDPFLGTYDDSFLLLELQTTLPVTVD